MIYLGIPLKICKGISLWDSPAIPFLKKLQFQEKFVTHSQIISEFLSEIPFGVSLRNQKMLQELFQKLLLLFL